MALRIEEGVRHTAADGQLVEPGDKVLQEVELGRNLGTADNAQNRPLRIAQRRIQLLQLELHRQAWIGRQQLGEAFGRGMRAVRSRKGVVDIDIAELRKL